MYNILSNMIAVQSLAMGAFMLLAGAFALAVVSYQVARPIAYTFQILDIANARKVHADPTPRTGGVMIFISFLIMLPLSGLNTWWYVLSLIAIFALGLWEDTTRIRPLMRLFGQVVISAFFVIFGAIYMTNYGIFSMPVTLALPFTIFCIVGVTNSYNIIDGLNGLASGCAVIFFSMMAYIAFQHGEAVLFQSSLIMAGCLFGFMVFNFPRGKIFLGDGGSYLVGFTVITMTLFAVTQHTDISPWSFLLMTIFPVFDTILAIIRRMKLKRSPFKADKKHLHHVLLRRYKSGIRAVVVIWVLQLIIGSLAVAFHQNTYALLLILLATILLLRRLWLKPTRIAGVVF
ncbi:MAG: glycosyltransferase family 4 protein [Thermodesulfovibrionales bacterium]